MIPVTVDTTLAWLLPYAAEWGTRPVATFELLTDTDAGRSGLEHRCAFSATLRTSFKFGMQLYAAEAAELLAALEGSTDNRPVLVPFWPAAVLFAERTSAPVTGGLRVWFEPDWSAYEIGLDTAANPSSYSGAALTAPLLWCRWASRPSEEMLTGAGDLDVSLEVVDVGAAAYALTPVGGALSYGDTVAGVATPQLLASLIDWVRPSASSEITVERERIGYGRAETEEFVAQLARRSQKLAVTCVGFAEIAQLIRLFLDRRGNVGSWWCPAFNDPTDSLLVRFKTAKLQLTWSTLTQADATVEVLAVPTEEAVPAGETVGSTIGDLGTPVWLYVVTDGDLTWRFTSFESAIAAGALGTFEPRPIDHGDITSEINLQRHDTDLTVGWFAGSPFERARLDRLAPPLTVQIYEGTLAAPAAAELIFTGKAAGYQFQGGKCTCKIAGPTALFDVRGPVAVTSPRCWTPMYSSLCGLSREALSVAAELVGIDADGTLRFVEAGAEAWGAAPVDHFRYGYAQRLLADGSRRRFAIVGSSGAAGAQTFDETRQWHPQITSRIELTFAGGMVSWRITVVQSSYQTVGNFTVRIGGVLIAEYTGERYLVGSVKEGSAPIAVGQHWVSLWADVVRVDDSGASPGPLSVQLSRPCPPPASYPESGWLLVPGCSHAWERCEQLGNSANFRGCPYFPKSNPAMVSVKQETSSGSKK